MASKVRKVMTRVEEVKELSGLGSQEGLALAGCAGHAHRTVLHRHCTCYNMFRSQHTLFALLCLVLSRARLPSPRPVAGLYVAGCPLSWPLPGQPLDARSTLLTCLPPGNTHDSSDYTSLVGAQTQGQGGGGRWRRPY